MIFTVWSWTSHYYPVVPLAWAMRAAGHEVVIAGQPALLPEVERSGHLGVACGEDVDLGARFRAGVASRLGSPGPAWKAMTENDREAVERSAYRLFVDVAQAMTDGLLRFAGRWRPDLIVHDPLTFAGPLVAARLGVPAVRFLFGPVTSPPAWETEELRPLCERLEVSEMGSRGDWTIDSCPPSMQTAEEAGHQPVRYVPYNGPGIEPGWVHRPKTRPRVLVSWGTSTVRLMGEGAFGLPTVVAAVARLDVDIVVAVAPRERSLLPELPPDVVVAESVPFHLLMPGCDVVLHQGGAGTMLTAAGLGLPQILFPLITDQLVNARSLAATGAGSLVIRRGEGEEEFRELIATTLGSVVESGEQRAAAGELRAEIARQPDPHTVVAMLEARTL
ncbi:nucleotide disphospho-sugar-binding domain-containing protein [Nonomuraea glycinis]|uniref:nucleotide disphospho-sugar-binding domain-containing protein n=1 Tax=Nonomuraea glycinis TaxID=2047744 RepID=UPI0033B0C8D3